MAFSPVPKESKHQIDKAGNILVKSLINDDILRNPEWDRAWDLVNKWRSCHAYPINTFQATLRHYMHQYTYKDPIIAQRLKRMPTIIDKLDRLPTMRLTAMQDIGGVRAILAEIEDVKKLVESYKTNERLTHKLIGEKDYIRAPRSADGYRSLTWSSKNGHFVKRHFGPAAFPRTALG